MASSRNVVIGLVIAFAVLVTVAGTMIMIIAVADTDTDTFGTFGSSVGVLEIQGVLTEYSGRPVVEQLDDWRENSSIKAIVLHMNTPGGGPAISQEIYDAVLRVRDAGKPVVVSIASVSASGGYLIACGADRIMANASSLTGSIGVIMQYHTAEGLLDKVGVGTETIKSGDMKEAGTYTRPLTEGEELMLKSVVMDSYEQFVQVVVDGRQLDPEDVYALADGSVFTGLQAMNLGLVDTLGGLYDAVNLAADLAGLEPEPQVLRPRKRESDGLFDLLGGTLNRLGKEYESLQLGPQLQYLYR